MGVLRGDEPVDLLASREGGSVIAVDAVSTSEFDVRMEVVSDEVLVVLEDDPSGSWEVSVLEARSGIGGFGGGVNEEGMEAFLKGDLRASTSRKRLFCSGFVSFSLGGLRDKSG